MAKNQSTAPSDDRGFTLVELLVVIVLMGVLGSLVTAAVVASHKNLRHTEDEAAGLADMKVVVERLGRDIRGARSIDAGATTNQLVLWLDSNSDFKRDVTTQPTEIVTWRLQSAGTGTGQFVTARSTPGATPQIQARTAISDIAFCYRSTPLTACFPTPLSAADAASTRLVTVVLNYDAAVGSGANSRSMTFTERIRNVS